MNNKLDKYFRDKLHGHGVQPSGNAWEKVESRLSKKNSTAVVLRIAAAVALMGLAAVVVLYRTTTISPPDMAKEENIKQPATGTSAPAKENTSPVVEPSENVAAAGTRKAPAQRLPSRNIHAAEEKKSEGQATVDGDFLVMELPDIKQPEVKIDTPPEKAKRIVIVYTLPTINKSVPTETEVKKTGLQKVVDVAMDMRSTEGPLGELREAKDDLFALEFRKDKKTKNQ
jgi:hypothetical protein